MHIVYLHGFASSPQSSKALFLAERLAVLGLTLHCPDFNQPDFSTLTVSRMLVQAEALVASLPAGRVVLVGSSLGAFVAVEMAARAAHHETHPIAHMVLLAPAVELEWERWSEVGPGGVERWRQAGSLQVFHYAYDEPRALGFSFYEDAVRYAPAARRLPTPMVIIQGRQDDTVTPASVARFAAAQLHATLRLVDDGHQLKESLELVWQEVRSILTAEGL